MSRYQPFEIHPPSHVDMLETDTLEDKTFHSQFLLLLSPHPPTFCLFIGQFPRNSLFNFIQIIQGSCSNEDDLKELKYVSYGRVPSEAQLTRQVSLHKFRSVYLLNNALIVMSCIKNTNIPQGLENKQSLENNFHFVLVLSLTIQAL